jgi:Domain of unknown function (DUF1931)
MPVTGAAKFQRFFRVAAGLDVDKDDLKRYSDFVNQKVYDLLIVGRAAAKANDRDIINLSDLPLTKGLLQSMHDFLDVDREVQLEPILEHLAGRTPLGVTLAVDTEARLPAIVGGLSVALARTFKIIDPDLKNPQSRQWERAFRLFDLLL